MKHLFFLYIIMGITLLGCNLNKKNSKDSNKDGKIFETIQDSILIGDIYYTESSLKYYSPNFLRYLKNEIFARKGYVFSDICLQSYFKSKDWYFPVKQKISLNNKENKWVELINEIEKEYKPQIRYEMRDKFIFENKPMFYIFSYEIKNNDENRKYKRESYFYLLDEKDSWILDCETIPPEFIAERSIDKIECDDASYPVSPEQIMIINFDSSCINGQRPELLIRLYGPSSDDEHNVIGFDNAGKLRNFVNSVYMNSYYKFSDSIIRILSTDRCDRIGTEFCNVEYNFNTITKKISKFTKQPYKHSKLSQTQESVKIYLTPTAAKRNLNDSLLYIIPTKSDVTINHYLDKSGVYQIEYKKYSGWITYEDLHKFTNISFAD